MTLSEAVRQLEDSVESLRQQTRELQARGSELVEAKRLAEAERDAAILELRAFRQKVESVMRRGINVDLMFAASNLQREVSGD